LHQHGPGMKPLVLFVALGLFVSSESVQGATLSLQRVHYIHSGHCLSASVLGVGDGIADDVLQEDLQDSTGLLVNEPRDALDSSSAR